MEAVVTVTPARRSRSTGATNSISSKPSASKASTVGMVAKRVELSRSKIVSDKALYRIEPNLAVANKRLVILGCGYVGSAVAARAIEAGMHVTTLTRNVEKADAFRKRGAEVIGAELANGRLDGLVGGGGGWVLDRVGSGRGGVSR